MPGALSDLPRAVPPSDCSSVSFVWICQNDVSWSMNGNGKCSLQDARPSGPATCRPENALGHPHPASETHRCNIHCMVDTRSCVHKMLLSGNN